MFVILQYIAAIIASLVTIVAGIFFLKKKIINPICIFFKNVNKRLMLIEKISLELGTNGGKSLKDQVTRIELRQILSDQRMQSIFNNSNSMYFEANSIGSCVWANKAYLKLVDKTLAEVCGHGWLNHIAEEDRNRVFDEWTNCINQERDFQLDFNYINNNGNKIPVHVTAMRLTDVDGSTLGWFGQVIRN